MHQIIWEVNVMTTTLRQEAVMMAITLVLTCLVVSGFSRTWLQTVLRGTRNWIFFVLVWLGFMFHNANTFYVLASQPLTSAGIVQSKQSLRSVRGKWGHEISLKTGVSVTFRSLPDEIFEQIDSGDCVRITYKPGLYATANYRNIGYRVERLSKETCAQR
jgi:hypothetical protein